MSEIAKKLSVKRFSTLFVELHSKDHSKMNQRWSYHDLFRSKENKWEIYYVEPFLKTKIKTKHYNCYVESNMGQSQCLDDFYMSKLNCTFPWLKEASKAPNEKCGSKHYIKNLVNLIEGVVKGK